MNRSTWANYPHKGFKILENVDAVTREGRECWEVDVWARWNKQRSGYHVVIQKSWWLVWHLGYLRRSDFWKIKWGMDRAC